MSDRKTIDCEEAVRRLAAYLDHELDPRESEELEQHLETCRSCYSRAEFERRLKEKLRRNLKTDDVPADFEERMRGLIRSLPREA